MWSPNARVGHVGLSAHRLTLVRTSLWRPGTVLSCDELVLPESPTGHSGEPQPWRPAVAALALWLSEKKGSLSSLHVVLSGRFVRWQLLPWRPELVSAKERATYASLRFQETYGQAAQHWRVLQSLQVPGQSAVACAIDMALLQALDSACSALGIRLASVKPYFSSSADCWIGTLNKKAAWFGVIESDTMTLGLLHHGGWQGMRSRILVADWRAELPGLMAQVGIASGLSVTGAAPSIPLYLLGTGEAPTPVKELPFTWLQPKRRPVTSASDVRLALGV